MIVKEPSLAILREKHPAYMPGSFVLVTPAVFWWEHKGVNITVPAGFVTNLASVPWLLRSFFPVNDNHRLAAVVHDYLYGCGGRVITAHPQFTDPVVPKGVGSKALHYTRHDADVFFYEIMRIDGVAKWRSKLMFWSVRRFGKSHWCQWQGRERRG